jgi:hypothetical protein
VREQPDPRRSRVSNIGRGSWWLCRHRPAIAESHQRLVHDHQPNYRKLNGMTRNERHSSSLVCTVIAFMTLFLQGCVSLQMPAKNGRPQIIGFGYTKSVGGTKGQVYQIVAPGLSLRAGPPSPGISFGWHQTRLFYPPSSADTNSSIRPVAIQTKCIGIDLAPVHIMVGFENAFEIPFRDARTNMIQLITYSENDPTNTIVEQKVIK